MELLANIQVLFYDAALLVVNKPAGLATLPDGYDPTLPHIKSVLEQKFGRLWVVHRLDKNTSGVLLLARTSEAHRSLNAQFEQHTVTKIYHALVRGAPEWEEKIIDLPLRPNGDRQHRTVIDRQLGKPATTQFRILERFENQCLMQAIPQTGRTHQIRVHLSAMGLSIVGDKLYGPRVATHSRGEASQTSHTPGAMMEWSDGIGLHAWSLEFTHPGTSEKLKINAPYPDSWITHLAALRKQHLAN